MENNPSKPRILWVIQDNQVTPHIADFLKFFKAGIGKVDIQLMIAEKDQHALEMLSPVSPRYYKVTRHDQGNTYDNFMRKKELIQDVRFIDGPPVWQVLLLDDLGAGNVARTVIHTEPDPATRAIVLQIPTPLGSTVEEELIFQAWVRWAHAHRIFIVGYELLSLYTRWTMLPSILDGIITANQRSYDYLTRPEAGIKGKVWNLPPYESNVFSVGTSNLWRNGLQVPYHYRMKYSLSPETTVLYIPHNVAMSYEYRKLVEVLLDYAPRLHLMFSIGKDQVRGTHNHEQIIRTISGTDLDRFQSCSFHDLNAPWEMVMADAVVACSECYSSLTAQANGIPSIVFDPLVPETREPNLIFTNSTRALKHHLEAVLSRKEKTTDLTSILFEILNGLHPKPFLT